MTLQKSAPLTLAAIVALGACADTGDDPSAAADAYCRALAPTVEAYLGEARASHPTPNDERYGGTVVVAGGSRLQGGMNPAGPIDHGAIQHQQFLNLMTLIDFDEEARPRPYLAESWELSDDGTRITWHLRRDVFWHDGEQTDAHDVAFTYRVVTSLETGFQNAAYFDHYVRGADGVEVVDDFTVVMHFQSHWDPLDPWRSVAIMPEHLLGEVPLPEIGTHPWSTCPVGNGPFVFESYTPNDRWEFVANPAFPEELGGRPFLDRYVYRIIPDQTATLAELLTGGIDVYHAVRPEQAEEIIASDEADVVSFDFRDLVMVVWNARRPQLADPRVRRAITMATDRIELVELIQRGYGVVAQSTVPPFHWLYEPGADYGQGYDPRAAAALLDEAGWTDRDGDGVREDADGTPLEITIEFNTGNRQRQTISEAMSAQLAEVGIRAVVSSSDFGAILSRMFDVEGRDFDAVVMGWVAEFRLDDSGLFHSDRLDEPFGWTGTDNPELDRLMDELRVATEVDEQRRLWSEYRPALAAEQPATLVYFADRIMGVSKRLRGYEGDPRGEWLSVRRWYLDPASR